MAAVPSIGRATGVELPDAASHAALHGLYHRHYGRVLGFCRNRLRTREEAEDAAQTTFCYALGALRRGVVPASEKAWLLKIARNVCLNRWAADRRRSLVEIARDPVALQEVAPSGYHIDYAGQSRQFVRGTGDFVVTLFFVAQRYFVRGIVMSGIKG